MWFHRRVRVDEWLLYATDSPSASGARGFARGSVFARDGRLVASTSQEGLMRVGPAGGLKLMQSGVGRCMKGFIIVAVVVVAIVGLLLDAAHQPQYRDAEPRSAQARAGAGAGAGSADKDD